MKSEAPLFYQSDLSSDQKIVSLDEETRKHIVTVLRMKAGDLLMLTNGKALSATATILEIEKRKVTVSLNQFETHQNNSINISLGISLLKNNVRFEWMLEKVTELGVFEIFPLISDRTERQHFRKERFEQIIRSACLQSEQYIFPVLHEPVSLEKLMIQSNLASSRFIAHCYDSEKSQISKVSQDSILLIGPEGDFTQNELKLADEHKFIPVSLGNTRLRTETAGVVGVALLRG
ncbi:MAG: 16S rRNA (uracil(1498)-N(3))-methyltransferase [Chitinophagia bacterium]|nr:16S rRNA (uracil(1498)-N(3))-methyltransferase [Chitinophagia bacterium]